MRACLCLFLLGGCLDSESPDDDPTTTTTTDASVETTAPIDTTSDAQPEPTPSIAGACEPRTGALSSSGVTAFDVGVGNLEPLEMDGAVLFGTRVIDPNVASVALVGRALPAGPESTVHPGPDVAVPIDAHDGAVLYTVGVDVTNLRIELFYRDADTAPTLLFTGHTPGEGQILLPILFGREAGPQRVVERGRAAWATSLNDADYTVELFHDGAVETVWTNDDPHFGRPRGLDLRGARVAFITDSGPNLWLAHAGAPAELIEGYTSGQTLSDDALWWISDGAVFRRAHASGDVALIDPGECGKLAADGDVVVALCGAHVFQSSSVSLGAPVAFVEGARVDLPTRGGTWFSDLVIGGRRVAWAEYDHQPLGDTPSARGEIVVVSLDRPDVAERVGLIVEGHACFGSTMHIELALTAQGVAWNHPFVTPSETCEDTRVLVGWALFDAPCP